MVNKKLKHILLTFGIILLFLLSAYFVFGYRVVRGDWVVGRVLNANGSGVDNETVMIYTSTMQVQCLNYSGCYCSAPRCWVNTTTDEDGYYSINTNSMIFEDDYYCNEGSGPEINITEGQPCAPDSNFSGDPGYCGPANPDGCVQDDISALQGWTNSTDPQIWANFWDASETRYEYFDIGLFDICNLSALVPPIVGTIPDQSGVVNTPWGYDLTTHMTDTINKKWRVKGVNPLFMDISINPATHVATFTPKTDKYGYDQIAFELVDTQYNATQTQEVIVFVNKTLEFKQGWNMWSLPTVENNSVKNIMAPFGNGNWGCGRNVTNGWCDPASGDFEGNWTLLRAQLGPNNWTRFFPDEYYPLIDSQTLQNIEPHYGYKIFASVDFSLTIDYSES